MTTIKVLKPFVFTSPAGPGVLNAARETHFHPRGGPDHNGEYDIADDDPMLEHPWVAAPSFADGKIESPAQKAERLAAETARLSAIEAERALELSKAQASTGMTERAAAAGPLDTTEYEQAIHTPLRELRARQGAGITTPSSKLREGQTKAKTTKPEASAQAANA